MSNTPISVPISYRGTTRPLSVLPESTLAELYARIEELTQVPPTLQKLLYKGKKATGASGAQDVTLRQAGFKDGMKVQMLGSTTQELESMKAVETENYRRERIMRERALKPAAKVCIIGIIIYAGKC
jgi:hypothetical protein